MSDYPVEVFEMLELLGASPSKHWEDVPQRLMEIGWPYIKRDNLHDDTGTSKTLPGQSHLGKIALLEWGKMVAHPVVNPWLPGMTPAGCDTLLGMVTVHTPMGILY
jgi:hypothetical protein